MKAPIIDPPHAYRFGEGQLASARSSIGRRMFRALARFSIAVLIGVGATLGWQSYGDATKEMLAVRALTLAWVLSVSTTKSPVVAATSTDPVQQLAPLVSNLDVVRRSAEQLAAKQEQMAQNIVAMQAVEEDIRRKMASTLPGPAQPAASVPQPKPPQPKAQSSAVQSSSAPRPPPPNRTTALALTAQIASGEIDQRLSFWDPVKLWRPNFRPQFTSS